MRDKLFYDHIRSVDTEIIRGFVPPLLACVELIVFSPALVDFLDHLLQLLVAQVLTLRCAGMASRDAGLHISIDEDPEWMDIMKDIVSTAANDNAVRSGGHLLYDIALLGIYGLLELECHIRIEAMTDCYRKKRIRMMLYDIVDSGHIPL